MEFHRPDTSASYKQAVVVYRSLHGHTHLGTSPTISLQPLMSFSGFVLIVFVPRTLRWNSVGLRWHRRSATSHYNKQESRAAARKPRDAASVLFRWSSPTTFTTRIRKTSQASKSATLQSSKHAGAKHNLTQNQDSQSIKVTCLESVEKQWGNK